MADWKVTFNGKFYNRNKEDCKKQMLNYMKECVKSEDVSGFNFIEVKEKSHGKKSVR